MNPTDEIVVIVDEQNHVVGSATRREMRAKHLPHRSTYIMVFNSKGNLYVQKRSPTKDIFPGYYDPFAGGVVAADESYETCAYRELEEEMGIREVPLTRLFEFYFADARARVWGEVFACIYDGVIVLQEEEVESGEFLSIDAIQQRAQSDPYTPDGLMALGRYLDLYPAGFPPLTRNG
ncbi:MAG: NUDIX hydrolase YfcD [Candidatus Tectomicrobia bacterium]|nr:NUDIX hydrolase YfcD [Candidatus Tectomicrobia bacterium]